MRVLRNSIQLIKVAAKAFEATRVSGRNHQYVKRSVAGFTEKVKALNDGSVPDKLFTKIQWYMSNTLYFGEMLSDLTGIEKSKKDDLAFMYLGALIAFTDILIDDYKVSEEDMKSMLSESFLEAEREHITGLFIEELFRLYLLEFYENFDHSNLEEFKRCLGGLMRAQVHSAKQFDDSISMEEVMEITSSKGGFSFALACSIFPQTKGAISDAMYKIGELDQFMNDSQDIHKDFVEGVVTFAHFQADFKGVATLLNHYKNRAYSAIKELPFDESRKQVFLFSFHGLLVGIFYKLSRFQAMSGSQINADKITAIDRERFFIDPFTPRCFFYLYPRMMAFDYKNCEQESSLRF